MASAWSYPRRRTRRALVGAQVTTSTSLEPQPANHLRGEHTGSRTAVAELQRDDQLAGHPLELERGPDPCGTARADQVDASENRQRWHRASPGHPHDAHRVESNHSDQQVMVQSVPGGCDAVVGRVAFVLRASCSPIGRCSDWRGASSGWRCFGLGISMFVTAASGWHRGTCSTRACRSHTGIPLGWVIEIVGFLLLLLWIPLRQRPGVGTILNALEIGLVVNLIGDHSAVHRPARRPRSPTSSARSS